MEQIKIGRIKVEDLKVQMLKGLHKSESLLENVFLLSADVAYRPMELKEGEYLDYARLAAILQKCMASESNLLEQIASDILEQIQKEWTLAIEIHIQIKKLKPHFKGVEMAAVAVELNWKA